jgi:thymidylate kinase
MDPAAILSAQRQFAPQPDIIFLLELPVDIALYRIGAARRGRFSTFEVRESLEAVDAVYSALTDPLIRRLDGKDSPEKIHLIIMGYLKELECWSRREFIAPTADTFSN